MPLGSRDILLVLRARNEAGGIFRDAGRMVGALGASSQVTGQNLMMMGAGLTAVGVAFTAAGAAGTAFFAGATNDAIEYRRQAALTVTQIDQAGVSIDTIGEIAKRVAKEVPAPFDQMQAVLYDIFSSMDVNVAQAEQLLTAFSKEAVAGQVGIQEAGRSTMAIMNAFKIPVSDVNKVLDLQFQLVRKGVGTFGEFSEVIGRVTPAAVAAGQSIESMAGMLAFLTRNGLSTAMAATSSARAMELLTKPDVISNLQAMGVKVKDSNGEFLQMRDIIGQLVNDKGWGKLTGPELKQAFQDTFGVGSIQARRFFDLVIPNFAQFSDLTDSMGNSAGAMQNAYDIMFDQPAAKAQELSNRWNILKVDVGERLIPVFESLARVLTRLLDAWDGLSPGTQDAIIKLAAIASVAAIVVGVITTIVGVFLMFAGAAAMAGVSLTVVGVVIAAIIATLIILAGTAYIIYNNWQTLVDFFSGAFNTVKDAVLTAFDFVKGKIDEFINWLIGTALPFVMYWVNSVVEQFNVFAAWWSEHVGPIITALGELIAAIGQQFGLLVDTVEGAIQFIWDIIQNIWGLIYPYIAQSMTDLWNVIQTVWDIIQNVVKAAIDFISWAIHNWGDNLVDYILIVWDGIKGIIEGVLQVIQGIIQVVTGIISGDWSKVWEGIKNVAQGVWNTIWAVISTMIELVANVIRAGMDVVAHFMGTTWDNIWNTIRNVWNNILSTIQNVIGNISGTISSAVGTWRSIFDNFSLFDIGRKIIDSLWNGIKSGFGMIKDGLGSLTSLIPSWKGPPDKDKRLLIQNGQLIMQGLQVGLADGWDNVRKQLMSYTPTISGMVGTDTSGPVGSYGPRTGGGAITIEAGAFVFHIDNATENVQQEVQAGIQAAFSQLADAWSGFNDGTP